MRTTTASSALPGRRPLSRWILACLVLLPLVAAVDASDIWVSHVSGDHGWRTGLSVYYSGGEATSARITISRFNNSGAQRGSPVVLNVNRNTWTPVPERFLAYTGSARAQSDKDFLLKATYRHGNTGEQVEQLLGPDARLQWVITNRVQPDFERAGIALLDTSDARATVTMEAWHGGRKVSEQSISLTPRARYVMFSDGIWNGITYRDLDKVIVRSSVQIAPPIWIIENQNNDRQMLSVGRPLHAANLCIMNGTLIDGTGGPAVSDAVVVVQSGIITAAGRRGGVAIPKGIRRLDARGGYILPGFINAHVHNAINETNLNRWLSEGVTSVRDVGARQTDAALSFRDQIRFDRRCARLVAAGPLVTVPGGYPIVPNGFPALAVTSTEDAREKIRELIDHGVDLIKLSLEAGQGLPTLTRAEVEAIVQTAHSRRISVTAHVSRAAFVQLAVDSGVDCIEHSPADRIEDGLIRRMVQAGTVLVPTLAALGSNAGAVDNLRRFLGAGGRVAMGNDGGYMEGLEIGMPVSELLSMEAAGMSRMQVIVSATRNAAEVCRLHRMLGTVERGKQADLLVVRNDPLADLRNLRDVQWVIRDGVVSTP